MNGELHIADMGSFMDDDQIAENRIQELYSALAEIKVVCLTAGAPGELSVKAAFSRIVRICIDCGVTENLDELRPAERGEATPAAGLAPGGKESEG